MSLKHGLVAGYHLEDTSDFSDNSNTLTYNGTTLTTDKNGVANKARDFNGTSDYIHLPNDTFGTLDNGTISMHIKFDSAGITTSMFSFGQASHAFDFRVNTSGAIRVWLYEGGYIYDLTTTNTLSTGIWYHILFKVDNTGNSIFVDGIQWTGTYTAGSSTTTGFLSSVLTTGDKVRFGAGYADSNYHNGKIDEVRIYDRALTQYEISQLYYGYDTENNQVGLLREGLEAEYHFSNNGNDSSGNANNGTPTGISYVNDKNAVASQAANFNASGDRFDCGSITDAFAQLTVSAWVKPTSVGTANQVIASEYNVSNDRNFLFRIDTSTLYVGVGNSSNIWDSVVSASGVITASVWQHVALVYNGSTIKGYVNGVEVSSTSTTGVLDTCTKTLQIGTYNDTLQPFTGDMDEVKIYSRGLTDTEIKQLYYGYDTTETSVDTLTGDLEAGYHFTGNTNDFSGNSNTGTNNGATLTTDKNAVSNQAYLFGGDSETDTIDCNFKPNAGSNPFTISCWFNATTYGAIGSGIMNTQTLTARDGISFELNHNGYLTFTTYINNVNQGFILGTTVAGTSVWNHAVATYDGTKIETFLNNVSEGTDTTANFTSHDNNLTIGEFIRNLSTRFWDGKIDEVRIYNRILIQDEITELSYNYDVPTMAEDTGAPSGYSNKVLGVTPSKINGIAVANISKFNGV